MTREDSSERVRHSMSHVDSGRSDAPAVRLTVLILSGNRRRQLEACLTSVAAASLPPRTEVLVAINGTQPHIEALVDDMRPSLPTLRTVTVAPAKPGAARNEAVRSARGEIVHFIDDDVTVDPWLFERIVATFDEDPGLGAVGGPNLTPKGSTLFQRIGGAVLGSLTCALPVRRRYSTQRARIVDERSLILCNLAIRRDLLEHIPFDATLVCAEENSFLRQAARRGERFYYRPDAIVHHERRPTFQGHLQQLTKYGRGRGQLARRDFAPSMVVYFAPLIGVIGVLAGALIGALGPSWVLGATAAAVGLYLAASITTAAVIAWRLKAAAALPVAFVLFPATHAAYGLGLTLGLIRPQRPKRSGVHARTEDESAAATAPSSV
jgi:GT2 family glycosyltransferase